MCVLWCKICFQFLIFQNQFSFHFPLLQAMIMNLQQKRKKIELPKSGYFQANNKACLHAVTRPQVAKRAEKESYHTWGHTCGYFIST